MKYYVSLGISSLEAQDRSRRTDRQFHRVREGRRVEDSQTRGGSKGRGHAVQDSSVVMPRYPVQAGTRQIAQCIKECVAVICKLTTLTSLLAELRLKLEACQLLVLPSTSFKVVGSKESPTFYLKQHKQPRCLTQTGFGFCIRITTGLRDQLITLDCEGVSGCCRWLCITSLQRGLFCPIASSVQHSDRAASPSVPSRLLSCLVLHKL